MILCEIQFHIFLSLLNDIMLDWVDKRKYGPCLWLDVIISKRCFFKTSVDGITQICQRENESDHHQCISDVSSCRWSDAETLLPFCLFLLFKKSNGGTSVPLFVLLSASLKINGGGHWTWCTGFQEKGAILPLLYPGAETSTWIWQHHLSKIVQE